MKTVQGSWLGHIWGVSEGQVAGLATLSRSRSLKQIQQSDLKGKGSINSLGIEPFNCSFSWSVSSASGTKIEEEIKNWEQDIGNLDYVYINESQYHSKPLKLLGFSASEIRIDLSGRMLSATFTASFAEVVEESSKARRVPRRQATAAQRQAAASELFGSGAEFGPSKSEKSVRSKNL